LDASNVLTLCPRQYDKKVIHNDDAVEILAPFVCSVWDAMAKKLPKDSNGEKRRLVSNAGNNSVFLMSNVPRFSRQFPSGVSDKEMQDPSKYELLDVPERANIAYVTIPVPTGEDYKFIKTNMMRLWRLAVYEIREEANRLHSENIKDPASNPPEITIKILWNNSSPCTSEGLLKHCVHPAAELALKILAIRLASCVNAIYVTSFDKGDNFTGLMRSIDVELSLYMTIDDIDMKAGYRQLPTSK